MRLNISVSRDSNTPLHEQVAAQIVLSIGSGKPKPGDALPSLSELALRLGIHRNTIAQAYHDPILNLLVEKRHGKRLAVRPQRAQGGEPIDDLIDSFLVEARQCGCTLDQVFRKIQKRMLALPPDRVLVLSNDAGMRLLLPAELKQKFGCRVEAFAVEELISDPELMMGALVVSPPGHIPKIAGLLPPERPAIPITYSPADPHLDLIRCLDHSSLIALVSISGYFLKTARAVLAPAAGRRHSMREYLLSEDSEDDRYPRGIADLVFCDLAAQGAARRKFPGARVVVHRMISDQCMDQISSLLSSSRVSAAL